MASLLARRQGFDSRQRQDIPVCRCVQTSMSLLSPLSSGYQGLFFLKIKQPGRKFDRCSSSSVEAMESMELYLRSSYNFIRWCVLDLSTRTNYLYLGVIVFPFLCWIAYETSDGFSWKVVCSCVWVLWHLAQGRLCRLDFCTEFYFVNSQHVMIIAYLFICLYIYP
jgi:hypothetical protein